ncbi:MAG: helicase HerA domain-containing protein [Nevskia sp.]|uniref:helicase HerA domain-containing protein n=1 Tax=Nevskia sp. TaxID=1929292 RepID=UPI00403610D5
MNHEFKESVYKGQFRPTEQTFEVEEKLRAKLGFGTRYEPARLMIGRSLCEHGTPVPVPGAAKFGKSIPGEHLFGDKIDLWISALVLDGGLQLGCSLDDFRVLVEAHWARGASLLTDEIEHVQGDDVRLAQRLSELLPDEGSGAVGELVSVGGAFGEIRLKVGLVSQVFDDGTPVDFSINGPGTSPHIALMGGSGKGKTVTGIQIAKQLVEAAHIPFLFIDNKGEFVENGKLIGALSSFAGEVAAIEVGTDMIPLDFLPNPDMGDVSLKIGAGRLRDAIALACPNAGPAQKSMLQDAITDVASKKTGRDLSIIRQNYERAIQQTGKPFDSVVSRLKELTELKCFTPKLTPTDFFSRSWVISLKLLPEELKKLVTLLLLESVCAYTLSQKDSAVTSGFRQLRHLLIVDEARKVLKESKNIALVDLITKSRSKGSSVMLLSQDPSDFEGQEYDFMTQIGVVIAYACNQSRSGLKALEGVFGRKLQANEFSDTWLEKGVAFCKLPTRQPERIQCWAESR